jgi:hypothetical protein
MKLMLSEVETAFEDDLITLFTFLYIPQLLDEVLGAPRA